MKIYQSVTTALVFMILAIPLAFADSTYAHVNKSDNLPKIGAQLWSVRDALKKDFSGTLAQIAKQGFEGVEFAGFYGPYAENPHELKQLLDKLSLTATGAHVGFDALANNVIDKNLLFFKTLGIEMVIVPWDERAWHAEKVQSLVDDLNRLSVKLAKYNMKIGFHNHQHEFAQYKQQTYWDYIAQHTNENVVLQLDVGWVRYAGEDAIKYIKRYPGRTLTTHYKIATKEGEQLSPIIGDNGFAWDKLIDANINFGNTQWIILEQEVYPKGLSSLTSLEKSKQGFAHYLK